MKKHNTIRTFIACPIPETALLLIVDLQDQIRSFEWKIKWVPVTNIHLTLCFLGDISPSQQQHIVNAITPVTASHKAFDFSLGNPGVFPNPKRPNVLWLGLHGHVSQLKAFQANIQSALKPLGFSENKRSFKAHLTLGRIKGPVLEKQMARVLCMDIASKQCQFTCNRLVFYQSKLSRQGASYSVLNEWILT
ncbi:MAG: 2'-5' RNA ligase [Candidatus Magnetoglobus multicellularis str. Araruama]|uniref:RNA 2',3'-cyclic phosphodiesterase n=1 Tax=Candidatus Magnetoglobus multicellularis str. Araruama TaxID=890399 RepID=A0A1V1PDT2_9BACT|nr:MAG: 2'-5' RNA ligase [Candidatus Magnetoglobus multicellularis str. Araruama]